MESIFKMAILRFHISLSEPCIFAIFEPKNFKFWILIENYITTNDTSGFVISCLLALELNTNYYPPALRIFFITKKTLNTGGS
jgi:hypothetical protein